jgi:hypothetical protein
MKPLSAVSFQACTLLVITALSFAGCTRKIQQSVRFPANCVDLDNKLRIAWTTLEDGRRDPKQCQVGSVTDICEVSRLEIERISMQCPGHVSAQFAGAILAFERRELSKAQQILDTLLSDNGVHPDAATLRARIALEEGNVPYAIRFLSDQVRLSPADYRLREALASSYYLSRRWQDAANELQAAEQLGAPSWRIAYHNGLILEAEGRKDLAVSQYEKVLQERPEYLPASDRLKALKIVVP